MKLNVTLENGKRNEEKVFRFWDNCIWRCCNNLFLLRRAYFLDIFRHLSLDIYLTTFFGVHKFKNTSAMRAIFCWKMFKIESKFRKCKKKEPKDIFRFWDNSVWKCFYKLPLWRREYLLSAVNVLTNSPKILHITQRDFLNLNCLHKDH